MSAKLKQVLSGTVLGLLGRRRTARLGRFLYNEACFTTANDPRTNGEWLVQDRFCAWARGQTEAVTVFDVGANIGEWTRDLSSRLKAAGVSYTIHPAEPFPDTYATLTRNLETWGLTSVTRPHNVALSDADGEREFFSLGANQGRNSLHPIPEVGAVANRTRVVCRSLDSLCQELGITTVHFVKIDTEGHDLDVVRGAKGLLASRSVAMLQFEYNHRWIVARHYLRDAFDLFRPLGYRLGKLTRLGIEFYDTWHPELESFREGNYLAVRPEVATAFPTVTWWGG